MSWMKVGNIVIIIHFISSESAFMCRNVNHYHQNHPKIQICMAWKNIWDNTIVYNSFKSRQHFHIISNSSMNVICFDMHAVDNEWWFLDFISTVLNVLQGTFILTIIVIIIRMTFRFNMSLLFPDNLQIYIIDILHILIQHIYFRSSQNEWVQNQSSQGTFSWNQQTNQYPEATTSHYPYNYPSNNNRSQQHYSNTYNFQQQQGGGARYSYQQSYYSYGYQCPNGDSRSSGASFASNNGNHQAFCHNIKEDGREQGNSSNEQKKVGKSVK